MIQRERKREKRETEIKCEHLGHPRKIPFPIIAFLLLRSHDAIRHKAEWTLQEEAQMLLLQLDRINYSIV